MCSQKRPKRFWPNGPFVALLSQTMGEGGGLEVATPIYFDKFLVIKKGTT